MRILHTVEFYAPSVGGAQEVVRQVSERLAARGHEVTVATTEIPERATAVLNGVSIVEFAVSGNAVRGFGGEVERYQEFLRTGSFDVMMNYAAQQWATDLALPLLGELPYARILAPCGFSGLYLSDYAGYFRELPGRLAGYDRILVHSETYRDARFVHEHGISRTELVPNAAGAEEFGELCTGSFRERHRIPADVPLLLTVGSHSGMKGHWLAIEAFRRARIGSAVLVVVGNVGTSLGCRPACERQARRTRRSSLGRKRVLLVDPPRAEVLEAYAAADLFVLCSRIECSPLVLFEAAASGTPFATVPAGNAEEIARWTGGGVVVPATTDDDGFVDAHPAAFARAIERLLADPRALRELGAAGRAAWCERFTWDAAVDRYERAYTAAIGERLTGSAP